MFKIGYLTTSLSCEAGWERYSRSLAESISKYADVRVLTQSDAVNETKISRVYPKLPHWNYEFLTQLRVFFNTLKYFKGCDIIHSLIEPFSPGAALASKLLGARFIMTLHGTYAVAPENFSLERVFLKIAYKIAALTTTGSSFTETKARRRMKFGECRFIPNGVDPKKFYRLPETEDENYILTVGWLKPRKGMDILIKAFNEIKDEFPELKCKLAGGVGDENFFDHLKLFIKENKLENKVEFLGRVSDEKLLKLYNGCSAFVFPARDIDENFEGFPMVFYEANACGAPVITTRGFGSEYAINDGYNGILVEPEDTSGVARAIRKLLSDRNGLLKIRANSLKTAENHTWNKIAEHQLMPFYHDALKR